MPSLSLIPIPVLLLALICSSVNPVASQQAYSSSSCPNGALTGSDSGYSCNGVNKSCHTYLIYRAQPPYNNASSIATLLGSDSSQITQLNNITESEVLVTRKEVIIPINCSCSGNYYQSNTSYVVQSGDVPSMIVNDTFEGLSTCSALQNQRSGLVADIFPDERLVIPLRCACPTKNQSDAGIKYLVTYVIKSGDAISTISLKFDGDVGLTLQANEKSEEDSVIQPFTTLLVPLHNPPNSSMTYTPSTTTPSPSSSSPPPSSSPPVSQSAANKWNYFAYGLIAGGGFVMILGAFTVCLIIRRFRKRADPVATSRNMTLSEGKPTERKSEVVADFEPLEFLDSMSSIAQSLTVYSFKDLQSATNNFNPSLRIGGSVYRGTIDDEQQQQQREIAVKRTNRDATKEINILNKINHFNITTLHGICYNDGLWYLVYDYAANGPLSNWIYQSRAGEEKTLFLSWIQRVQISVDVATGLDYLHNYTNPPHVHKDLKCSHILLDGELRAKISHFGLSKSVGGEEGGPFALTEHIVGTKGYMAPEYLENGLVTPKMDIYAFGIFLVEILSGREVDLLYNGENVYLSEVLEVLGEQGEKLRAFMDPGLQEMYPIEVATAMVKLAQRCVRNEPSGRPGMDETLRLLSKALTSSLMRESFAASISSHTTTSSIQ